MSKTVIIVSENKICELFNIPDRTIRENFKAAKIEKGKYDLQEVIKLYVQNQEREKEKLDLAKTEKELKEVKKKIGDAKLKIIEKDYILADEVELAVANMIYRFKNKIISLPKKIANSLKNKNFEEYEKTIDSLLKGALKELKDYKDIEEENIYE